MSEEASHEHKHDREGSSGQPDIDDGERSDADAEHDATDEPEGAEILLPRSNWLRIAWVLLAVFWMLAMVAIFVQSCSPR
jgi:hypothetical protein